MITVLALLLQAINAKCQAQNYGYRNYSGFGGNTSNGSFNGGFGGLSPQTQQLPQTRYQAVPSQSNGTSMAALEQTLNAIDTRTSWERTPVSVGQSIPAGAPATMGNTMGGIIPGLSRQEMLRVFLEGGTPQTSDSYGNSPQPANSSANTSTAYSNYQRAQNEANKARNEANTARYNKDKWYRKNAATQAEYAANNAEYAAQRAESAAYSGDSQARSYANLARQAANRARQSAKQARYNADTL